jgi:hypothetical protein
LELRFLVPPLRGGEARLGGTLPRPSSEGRGGPPWSHPRSLRAAPSIPRSHTCSKRLRGWLSRAGAGGRGWQFARGDPAALAQQAQQVARCNGVCVCMCVLRDVCVCVCMCVLRELHRSAKRYLEKSPRARGATRRSYDAQETCKRWRSGGRVVEVGGEAVKVGGCAVEVGGGAGQDHTDHSVPGRVLEYGRNGGGRRDHTDHTDHSVPERVLEYGRNGGGRRDHTDHTDHSVPERVLEYGRRGPRSHRSLSRWGGPSGTFDHTAGVPRDSMVSMVGMVCSSGQNGLTILQESSGTVWSVWSLWSGPAA